jgi:segregation and condensation protein B
MSLQRPGRGAWGRANRGERQTHPLVARGGVTRSKPVVGESRDASAAPPPISHSPGPELRSPEAARLEAVMLLADVPLAARKLAQFAGLADGTLARTLIRQLNQYYDQAGTAFRVEEVAGGYQLLTRPKFSKWLRRLFPTPVQTRLSGPALETLAVVAYRQPVLRADIEAVRGVQCGEMLRQLLERDLIRIGGRASELGRPFLYTTTKRFLQVFGLRHLDDLPRAEFLRPSPASGAPAADASEPRDNESNLRNAVHEESEVSIAEIEPLDGVLLSDGWERLGGIEAPSRGVEPRAEEDDDDFEDDDDADDDDDDDEEDDVDDEDDDWEEVDDEDDDLDEDEDEEDDEDDDDWDDDEDDDWDDDDDDEVEEDEEEDDE